ncbi:MAG: hypothetical protein M1816_001595 [Peltula sp. TS41687]|nr:MAG: hypothetical protein M1816_001595 [Peltula sp. TS41687]
MFDPATSSLQHLIILLVVLLFARPSGVRADENPVHFRLVPQLLSNPVSKATVNKPLKVTNGCPETIYPAISTQAGVGPGINGFELRPGTSRELAVSSDWQGRVWGRTNCSFNAAGTGASNRGGLNGGGRACTTGDCGGIVNCRLAGEVPATLAEFTLDSPSGQTFYDISLVDGYNLPMAIVLLPAGTAALAEIPPNLTNPSCVGTAGLLASEEYNPYLSAMTSFLGTNSSFPLPFEITQKSEDVASWCPWDLQLQRPSKPGDGVYPYPDDIIERPAFDPCYSACAKYNRPRDCCTQMYNSPLVCKPSMYSRHAKAVCPDAYSFAYDDQTSTFIIPTGGGFDVVFCPGGRSTNILATKAAQLRELSEFGRVTPRSLDAVEGHVFVTTTSQPNQGAPARSISSNSTSFWALVAAFGATIGVLEALAL